MLCDVVELREFYQSPLGQVARQALRTRVQEFWPHVTGERIAVIGYGTPLLRPWLGKAQALYSFMPAAMGVAYWPRDGANVSALVEADNLPLPDNSLDRIVIVHALEGLTDSAPLLREVWRVLKSGGRLLTIVPNRRSLWALSDHTPFGNGQPFSLGQIKKVLHNQGFVIERGRHALYALPGGARFCLACADRMERWVGKLFPALGGVLMLEAGKQLYAPIPEKKKARHRLLLPLTFKTPYPHPLPAGRICEKS